MPRALIALLAAVACLGCAWALVVPPWQSPDEQAHFGYVQTLAETGDLPGDRAGAQVSTEQEIAMRAVHAQGLSANLELRPQWDQRAYERWSQLPGAEREDGGDLNPASANPPLYYAYEAVAYKVAGGDIFDRLYLVRLWSALLLVAAAAFTWLLAGEVFGRDRLIQLAAAAVVGLQPMATFIGASVNPDSMVTALFALSLWLAVRILKRGLTPATGFGLVVAVLAATQAKPVGWTLAPAAVFTLALAVWRRRQPGSGRSRQAAQLAVPVGAAILTAGATAALLDRPLDPASTVEGASAGGVGGLLSYLWQFYFPPLPFQDDIPALPDYPLYDTWISQGWGAFGWLEVQFPEWVYGVLAAVSGVFLIGGLWTALRRRPSAAIGFLFFLVTAGLLAGLHWTEYKVLYGTEFAFNQGRYLLPLLPLGGLLVASLVQWLEPRRRPLAVSVLLGCMAVLQLFALAIVDGRFYA